MKRVRAWEEVSALDNLWNAWRDFERGKRRRPEVALFGLDADQHVHRLHRALRDERWRPGRLRLLRISDPKRRLVSAAPVADRVIHHALYRVLGRRFERSSLAQSYACLPGRGSHRAVLRYLGELRRWPWVLHLDIARYFYTVDRAVLAGLLFRRLPEAPLRGLLGVILDSGQGLYADPALSQWLGWDAPGDPALGLPIGNLTSQWWGNLYLDGLDHFIKRDLRVQSYQRYMDDLTLFGSDRASLLQARDEIAAWLAEHRHLRLKDPDARPRRADRPQGYLGYRVTRAGLSLGPKAKQRVHKLLRAHTHDPERVQQALASLRAAWMFGGGDP